MVPYCLKICVCALMMLSACIAAGQNPVEQSGGMAEKQDTLSIASKDTTALSKKHRYDSRYFHNTFSLSQEFGNEFVAVKKSKYAFASDDNVADVAEKMPTVHNADGKYYVQGQSSDYMMVDSYTIFPSNHLSVNNFPEAFIDTVYLFEDPSLLMTYSGIMDDDACEVISLVSDTQYAENSLFGRFYGGWGISDKWDAGAVFNYFDGNRRLNFTAQSNNVNQQRYSPLDLSGMLNANAVSRFNISSSGNQSLANSIAYHDVNQTNGINSDFSAGIRYLDVYKKIKYYFNYFYTATDNQTEASLDYFYHADKENHSEQSVLNSTNNTHRINGKLYYYADDRTLLRVTPTVHLQNLTGTTFIDSRTSHSGMRFSENNAFSGSQSDVAFDFIHDFRKKGRNLMISCTPQYSRRQNSYDNYSQLHLILTDSLSTDNSITIDGFQVNANISYTEPAGEKGILQLLYSFEYEDNNFKRQSIFSDTDIFNAGSIDSVSMRRHETGNRFISHSFGGVYQLEAQKWRLNLGCRALLTYVRQNSMATSHESTTNTAVYPAPSFNFHYYINRFSTLKIGFKSYATAPELFSLQETLILQGPLHASYGNRRLKYSWNNAFNIRYTRLNRHLSDYFFASMNVAYSNNYTANNLLSEYDKFYNPDVVQSYIALVSPENMNTYLNVAPYLHYTLPLARIKTMLDMDIFGQYAHVPTVSDGQKGFSNQFQAGGCIGLKSGISDRIDFLLSSYSTYNHHAATWDKKHFTQYVYQRTRLKISLLPCKQRILLQSDLSHNFTWGHYNAYKEISNDGFFLWNISAGYKFMKDRSLTIKGTVHDILNQNRNIYQYTTAIYSESIKTNDLKRYFMISLVYDLNKQGRMKATQ